MGIWVQASLRYGCVFERRDFLSVLKDVYESKHGKKDHEEQFLKEGVSFEISDGLDMEGLAFELFAEQPISAKTASIEKTKIRYLTVEDSVDDDDDDCVYLYLGNRGFDMEDKGGSFEYLDKKVFQVSDEDIEYLNKELASVGLQGKGYQDPGWMFKSSWSS